MPPPPPPPKTPSPPKKPVDADSTVLAPRPDITDDTGALEEFPDAFRDGIVFASEEEDSGRTVVGRGKPKIPEMSSSDVSLIEAPEEPRDSLDSPRITSFGDGALVEDYHPPTEVLRLAFSHADEEAEPELSSVEPVEPVELKKWKMGLPKASAAEGDTNETPLATGASGTTPVASPAPSSSSAPPSSPAAPSSPAPSSSPAAPSASASSSVSSASNAAFRDVSRGRAAIFS